MRRTILIAVAAALLAPQAAQAASLDALKPCYRSIDANTRETVTILARDFTPGSKVDVLVDGTVVEEADVLLDGTVRGAVLAPYRASGERSFTVTVTQQDQPTTTASAASLVTALAMRLKPQRARPSAKVRFIGRGFTDGDTVYGHYLRAGKVRKTVALGPPEGPCGTLDVKRRQMPIKKPKTGKWTLQVDNTPSYSPQPAGVLVRLAITVRKVLRSQDRR